MSHTRYRIFANEQEYPYFLTCTVVGWLPVFTRPEAVQIVFDSWKHLHLIAQSPALSGDLQRFKSFTARKIIELLQNAGELVLLDQLERLKLDHKTGSTYQFWQEGSKPKQIRTDRTLWQKLEYIHRNPVERGYVDDPVHWRYSSARNYARMPGLVDVVTDWM